MPDKVRAALLCMLRRPSALAVVTMPEMAAFAVLNVISPAVELIIREAATVIVELVPSVVTFTADEPDAF